VKQLIVLLIVFASFSAATSLAQDISGSWVGELSSVRESDPFHGLRILLTVSKAESGGWKAVLYTVEPNIEKYGGRPLPVTSIRLENPSLQFSIDTVHGQYVGTLSNDASVIKGRWTQGNGWRELDLRRRIPALTRIGSEELEQVLDAARGKPDTKVAEQLSGLELTDRLSAVSHLRDIANMLGPHAKQAFLVLADKSALLDPPASEIPSLEVPDGEAQRRMIALTVDYVKQMIHQMPNLFATRSTTSLEEDFWDGKTLHPIGKFSTVVLYRDGRETHKSTLVRVGEKKQPPNLPTSEVPGLTTIGEFGPILSIAMMDAPHGDLVWKRWEAGAEGPEAVFSYAVSAENSHYRVDEICSAYRGEFAINPATGAILRLVIRADPEIGMALLRADIAVEYGPVRLGDKTYICPVKSIAISRRLLTGWLNDVVFDQYHLYRATSRVLPGFTEAP